jgi:hypothetical protein
MLTKLRRWFFGKWHRVNSWIEDKDVCEICGEERADTVCIGCGKRICWLCNSLYYIDEDLCTECRRDITPEEEEAEDSRMELENEDDDA